MSVQVILPVLDEVEALPGVLDRMPAAYEPIVVDNGSTDGSGTLAAELGALVVHEPRRGFGAACFAGLLAAEADVVCFMDCDGSLDPQELPRVAGPVLSDQADLVMGARRAEPGAFPLHARVANRLLALEMRRRSGLALRDLGPMRAANRQALLDLIGQVSREVVGGYDRDAEARAIANDVQGTFATTALAEAGAVGLGTLVATVVTGAAADVTGILLAAALAVGGFYVIPRKRRQATRDFQRRVAELRTRLRDGLTRQVHHEIAQSTDRVNEAVAPYRRFVQSQQQRINEARGELVATEDALVRLRGEIERR